jgi:hypothetical protein
MSDNNNLYNNSHLENKISKVLVMNECRNKGPNNKLLKKYKESLINLSPIQCEIIIGLILGDASLQTQNNGETYRIKFEYGDKNKKYAEHIHKIFNE